MFDFVGIEPTTLSTKNLRSTNELKIRSISFVTTCYIYKNRPVKNTKSSALCMKQDIG